MKDEVSSSQSKSQYIPGRTGQKVEKVKRSKSQKVKRSKGQKVTLAVLLERHPGILPDHAEPRAEDAVRLLPHYH